MQKIKELHSAVSHVMLLVKLDKWDMLVCWAVLFSRICGKSDLIWESPDYKNNNKRESVWFLQMLTIEGGLPCFSFTKLYVMTT
jgi:hypothetical protein